MNYFVLTIFVLLPLLGIVLAIRRWRFLRRGVRVSARIVGFETLHADASADRSTINLPIVEFDSNGRRVRITLSGEPPEGDDYASQGDTVRLIYPRGKPRRATYDNRIVLWLVPVLCFIPAAVFIVFIALSIGWYRLFAG
jgi:uncharacterized protein DUF3592